MHFELEFPRAISEQANNIYIYIVYILKIGILEIYKLKYMKNVKNVENSGKQIIRFVQELVLCLCNLPFSPKYCSQGLDLFQSVIASNKY